MSLTPQRLSPDFERTLIIPVIIKNRPITQIMKPITHANNVGLNMNTIPKIRAMIPNINTEIPKVAPLISPISDIPANIRPIPSIRTKNPEITANGTNPKIGKAITINPRIIKINAIPIFYI